MDEEDEEASPSVMPSLGGTFNEAPGCLDNAGGGIADTQGLPVDAGMAMGSFEGGSLLMGSGSSFPGGMKLPSALPSVPGFPREPRKSHGGDLSEGPSESSAHIEDTEDDDFTQSTIPNLERFYEQMAEKARLPRNPGTGASNNWVLSLARSYRRLNNDKRRRGRLRDMRAQLQPPVQGGLSATSTGPGGLQTGLPCHKGDAHLPGWSSTEDSGYEAGYETDADESELSEWEGNTRQGHKRKLDALMNQLAMQLEVSRGTPLGEESKAFVDENINSPGPEIIPPWKAQRALGTPPSHAAGALPSGSGGRGGGTASSSSSAMLPPRVPTVCFPPRGTSSSSGPPRPVGPTAATVPAGTSAIAVPAFLSQGMVPGSAGTAPSASCGDACGGSIAAPATIDAQDRAASALLSTDSATARPNPDRESADTSMDIG